jgi:hypothetical protein
MMITAEPTEIHIPAPLDHQWPIVESAARFKVVRAGRRGGKTVLAEGCAIVGHGPEDAERAPLFRGIVHDLDVVWVARDYTQAGIMWHEFIRPRFKGVPGVRVNEAERTVTILGAGTLFVISAENIASARGMGKRLAGMIVEEAAWLDLQSALKDVILPALMDNEGWLLLISTTNAGQDGNQLKEAPSYFNRICQDIRAGERSDEWAEFHFTAEDNPKITARAFQSLVAEYAAGSAQLEQEVYAKLIVGGVGLALEQVEGVQAHRAPLQGARTLDAVRRLRLGLQSPVLLRLVRRRRGRERGQARHADRPEGAVGRARGQDRSGGAGEVAGLHRRRAGPGQRRQGPRRVRPDAEGDGCSCAAG